MALSEIALLSLAWNLAADPKKTDIDNYYALPADRQIQVQLLIERYDILPELMAAKLKEDRPPRPTDPVESPSAETSISDR